MEKGTVKWFNNAKGFGFICPEGGGEDIFAHYSTIQMDGYRTLKAGQSVQFDVHQGKRQSRQCYCARRSRSGSRIALLSHCVHPKGKMPARSAGIFISKITLVPEHLLDPVVPHFVRVTIQIKSR